MVAYQVLGEGPFDVVYVPGAIVSIQGDCGVPCCATRRSGCLKLQFRLNKLVACVR